MTELKNLDPKLLKHVLAGKITIDKDPNILQILGLGSCIALTFYFPDKKIGAMAHIVLPARDEKDQRTPHLVGKYANSALDYLMNYFKTNKLNPKDAIIKMTGGSKMFVNREGSHGILNIADRNIKSVRGELEKYGLKVSSTELGGNKGRSVFFHLDTGKIKIYLAGGIPKGSI